MKTFKKNPHDSVLPNFPYLVGESSALNLLLYLRAVWNLDVLQGYELVDPPREVEPSPGIVDIEISWERSWESVVSQELGTTDQSRPVIGWDNTDTGRVGWSRELFYQWTAKSIERTRDQYGHDLLSLPEARNHAALDQAHSRGLRRTLALPLKGVFCLDGQDSILVSEGARTDKDAYNRALIQWQPNPSTVFRPTELRP